MTTLHEAAKQAIWKTIEQYRTSGGREEHWRNRDALDITIDEALRSALEEATTKELPSGSVTRCRKCGETVEVAFLYAKNEAPKITFLDAEAAFQSRIGIDETPYDRESFLAGYEQGKYDEEMRQGSNFAAPTQRIPENCGTQQCSCIECLKTPEPGDRKSMSAQLRQYGGDGGSVYHRHLLQAANMLEADAITDRYVLVPVEPTPEMLAAGHACPVSEDGTEDCPDDYRNVYKVMLAAAPKGKP